MKIARSTPISVAKAKPYLEAFKAGDAQTQRMVTELAASARRTTSASGISGQEFRQQLDELAAVVVNASDTDAKRVEAFCELAAVMPRKHRLSETSTSAILGAFEELEASDRAELAPLLLSRLFRAERLRWKIGAQSSGELYTALIGTRADLVTSRDELQKLVADRATSEAGTAS
jgi:hypothetical protein